MSFAKIDEFCNDIYSDTGGKIVKLYVEEKVFNHLNGEMYSAQRYNVDGYEKPKSLKYHSQTGNVVEIFQDHSEEISELETKILDIKAKISYLKLDQPRRG